jgi:hypothetical protein
MPFSPVRGGGKYRCVYRCSCTGFKIEYCCKKGRSADGAAFFVSGGSDLLVISFNGEENMVSKGSPFAGRLLLSSTRFICFIWQALELRKE